MPPPGTPTDFSARLLPAGALEISWKCANPANGTGTVYEVARKIGDGAMAVIAAVGARKFVDDALPAGATPVTYRVTAVRSTKRGEAAPFTVYFGVDGAGAATVSMEKPPRMAA